MHFNFAYCASCCLDIKFKTQDAHTLYCIYMVEKSPGPSPDLFVWPFVAGKMATEMALTASVSFARMVQIAAQSTNTALDKYIELAEQEMKRAQRRESVKVE